MVSACFHNYIISAPEAFQKCILDQTANGVCVFATVSLKKKKVGIGGPQKEEGRKDTGDTLSFVN